MAYFCQWLKHIHLLVLTHLTYFGVHWILLKNDSCEHALRAPNFCLLPSCVGGRGGRGMGSVTDEDGGNDTGWHGFECKRESLMLTDIILWRQTALQKRTSTEMLTMPMKQLSLVWSRLHWVAWLERGVGRRHSSSCERNARFPRTWSCWERRKLLCFLGKNCGQRQKKVHSPVWTLSWFWPVFVKARPRGDKSVKLHTMEFATAKF